MLGKHISAWLGERCKQCFFPFFWASLANSWLWCQAWPLLLERYVMLSCCSFPRSCRVPAAVPGLVQPLGSSLQGAAAGGTLTPPLEWWPQRCCPSRSCGGACGLAKLPYGSCGDVVFFFPPLMPKLDLRPFLYIPKQISSCLPSRQTWP